MSNSAMRWFLSSLVILGLSLTVVAQNSLKPLRASEVMALAAGGAFQANLAHDITARGLSFHADDAYLDS